MCECVRERNKYSTFVAKVSIGSRAIGREEATQEFEHEREKEHKERKSDGNSGSRERKWHKNAILDFIN